MISLEWVKDYIDISDQDLKELAVKITKAGINVEKVVSNHIDYLVIDIMNLDDNNKFLGYFLFLSRIKEKNEKNNIYSIDDD